MASRDAIPKLGIVSHSTLLMECTQRSLLQPRTVVSTVLMECEQCGHSVREPMLVTM